MEFTISPSRRPRHAIPGEISLRRVCARLIGDVALPKALTFDFLCDVLEQSGLLSTAQKRDASSRVHSERARIVRQRAGGPRARMSAQEDLHPAEILAGMGFFIQNDDRYPLTERAIMQALAQFT